MKGKWEDIIYEYNDNTKTLIFSGKGTIPGYRIDPKIIEDQCELNDIYKIKDSVEHIIIKDDINEIGKYALSNFNNLEDIEIGNGIKKIDDYAISNNKNLTDIKINSSIQDMGKRIFQDNQKLNNISLGDNTLIIGEGMLHGCSSLKELNIPYGVKEVCPQALIGCFNLKNIYFDVDQNGMNQIEKIDPNIFISNNKIENIYLTEETCRVLEENDVHFISGEINDIDKIDYSKLNNIDYSEFANENGDLEYIGDEYQNNIDDDVVYHVDVDMISL